ncbi:MAG TPA: glycoside hydrolase family 19 protein [Solirubrobacteraceae bacterium]|jgi:putative chitinase|nr:glycoside hydrolase family 19 protein [Solirubrobacteraceae bacterium]
MSVNTAFIAAGVPASIAEQEAPLAEAAMTEFSITSQARAQMFLAQVLHESGGLCFFEEIWGPTAAQSGYEGRRDLGNTESGDGKRFKGRGPIQLTGRANYRSFGPQLALELEKHPEMASQHAIGWRIAGLYWKTHGCNELADQGDFVAVTKRINGGTTGLADRQRYLHKLQGVDCRPRDPWAQYTPAERRWITEYDSTQSPDRRRVLRRVMTEQRKRIFVEAARSGWDKVNRRARWRSLRSRTHA